MNHLHDIFTDLEYVARCERLIFEYVHAADPSREWLGQFMSPECPDCRRRLDEPDGWHVLAGIYRPFAVLVTCCGRRVIPLPDLCDTGPTPCPGARHTPNSNP